MDEYDAARDLGMRVGGVSGKTEQKPFDAIELINDVERLKTQYRSLERRLDEALQRIAHLENARPASTTVHFTDMPMTYTVGNGDDPNMPRNT